MFKTFFKFHNKLVWARRQGRFDNSSVASISKWFRLFQFPWGVKRFLKF